MKAAGVKSVNAHPGNKGIPAVMATMILVDPDSGEINVPLSKGLISRQDIYADIREIVSGKKPGRDSPDETTVFDSTGLAIQDISAASEICRKLMSDKSLAAQLKKIDLV